MSECHSSTNHMSWETESVPVMGSVNKQTDSPVFSSHKLPMGGEGRKAVSIRYLAPHPQLQVVSDKQMTGRTQKEHLNTEELNMKSIRNMTEMYSLFGKLYYSTLYYFIIMTIHTFNFPACLLYITVSQSLIDLESLTFLIYQSNNLINHVSHTIY